MARIFCHEKLIEAINEVKELKKLDGNLGLGAKLATAEEFEINQMLESFSAETLLDSYNCLRNHLLSFCHMNNNEFHFNMKNGIKNAHRLCAVRRMW